VVLVMVIVLVMVMMILMVKVNAPVILHAKKGNKKSSSS
jgi:hypothetical protein